MRSILMPTQASKLLLLVLAFLTVSSVSWYMIVSARSFPRSFEKHLPSAWKAKPTNNYGFSLFLAGPVQELQNDNDDHYYVATRMIIYQLLHDPATRTNNSYPVVVLVTEDVVQSKRDRLSKDGATVIPVEKLSLEWAPTRKAWQDVLTKLRLFELVQFDKLVFLDSDTLVTRRLDGIFEDEAAQLQQNLGNPSAETSPADEGIQPSTYLFAGNTGAGTLNHSYPQLHKGENFNAGCIVFQPSLELFDYYMTLSRLKDRFNGRYPEQNLWGYAHRRKGNMPWKQLHYDWNTNYATWADYKNGIVTLHAKFWEMAHDKELGEYSMKQRWMMEGYWAGVDRDAN